MKDTELEKKVAALTKLYDSFDRNDLAGGYAVAILKEGQVFFMKSYGIANHECDIPFTSQTIFDFASVAKQFTGFCVADLIRQNRLSMDDNVRDYLPELPDYGQAITIQHLLGHTSGLRDWFPLVKLVGRGENDTITEAFLMKLICRQKALNFDPGSQHAYSNTGYFLLAEIIHRVAGKSLRAYAHEKIFTPLEMDATFFLDNEREIIQNRAAPYQGDTDNIYGQGVNQLTALGSSSLFSNLDDMFKWTQYLDRCVSEGDEIFKMMLTPTVLTDGKKINYNFGIAQGRWRDHLCIGHGGGWNAFACEVVYFPVERISISFITNRSPNHVNTHDAVRCILFDEPEITETETGTTTDEKTAAPQIDPAETPDLLGDYYSDEIQATYTVHVKDKQLILEHLVNEDITLREVEPGIYQSDKYWCNEIVFTRNKQGKVDEFYLSASAGNLMKNLRFVRLGKHIQT